MKRTTIISFLALPLLCTSCLFDEEDLFDKTASERIEAAKVEAKAALESAPNGWHVRYFPSATQEFGGYNVFFKFADGQVTVASETESDPSTAETSLYSLGEDLGVTLNFDTKNSVINYFVHPRNPDGLGSTYKGMEGDYKFMVMETSPERIRLRGIISGNSYILTPMASDADWATEVETYQNCAEDMEFNSYSCVVNGKTYSTVRTNRRLTIRIDDQNTVYAPFIYTKTGISFYEPITIDGVTAQDFNFVDEYYFVEANGADFKIMTPEPIRSDITFDVAVPEEAKTYKSATVEVKPSNDTEYYYIGTMLRSEYETYREKKLLQELVGALNSQIGSGDDVNEFAKKMLYQGDGSYTLNYPSFYDEYVAIVFGCAVSEGSILSTTSVTAVPFSVDASLLPESTNDLYKRWLGKWAVTSTSSETSGTSYTFYITIKPNAINSSFKINGWGYTVYANLVDIAATYSGGNLRVTGNQADLYTTSTGTIYLANRYVDRDTGSDYGIVNSTNASNLVATYSEDEPGKATMVGRNGSLTSGVNFTITCLELYERRTGSSSYYYLPIAEGYTSLDYFVGPYTMVQLVDAEGNELSPAASAATKQQVPFFPASAIGISGSEQCKAVE
ncbi:MAG TPA: DUF4302 domain-containing protein [Candidatus Alistipes avistercoris]|jgi:hypothetical protein|uniref:DUF4302 domain-containing protein n=1 Tax=uncultured Alistipes sp. TaxID=538949 RepID=UPI001F854D7B|nr:DUF4302 domain-containing protein [uncultured Alistipes sp.]HIX97480.1 DUF4302 domain-containing protein [Candidatus Alistipes avistercoris]